MRRPTLGDHVRLWFWNVVALMTPAHWSPGDPTLTRHWRRGEPATWQGRLWLKNLSNAYYYAELVAGRIPASTPEEAPR